MNRTLLIDGDEFVYVSCVAVEYEAEWDEQNIILASNQAQAWDTLQGKVKSVLDIVGEGDHKIAFAFGSRSFRKDIYPEYKAKRGKRLPLCYDKVLKRVYENYVSLAIPPLEGDDVLAIMATNGKHENPVIVSQDKDMLTVPGTLFREGTLMLVSEGDADFYWLKQTLTGDTSDGYPGCPGVGPVGAEKLLNEFVLPEGGFNTTEAWNAVVRTFEAKGLTADDALTQARLARIVRDSDWDNQKMEVKLWAPTVLGE